ncbi:small GTP-binding protein, putative [Trichomonas vaginalis G3]|uniref:Small GTP-binding protein, putative n=1 Tax=Trichomonas vaginalis (strain ATCC PRA-98 / G3) TaxID=412133 RepID=A2E625_TRIV3|nr:GTPase protein [Trichomonas vaginalis G3]EAY11867.1 small GTP-binding protein, putative [Trichomonas vaginalis G3]KAI5532277.1 GTPase protein [Trichomonas vaginalis G3]|eukprot:XP_001324090.1 small GTP-binding protein [Trichomonas vaginalis G3]
MLSQKVVMVGDSSVGKTCIVSRLINSQFNSRSVPTVVAQYHQYSVTVNDISCDLDIYDTAGQDQYKSLAPLYYRGASIGIFVFDVTIKKSFENLPSWIESFKNINGDEKIIVIAGNKIDMPQETWQVDPIDVDTFARNCGYQSYMTSAFTGQGINELFLGAATQLIESRHSVAITEDEEAVPRLQPKKEESKKCC